MLAAGWDVCGDVVSKEGCFMGCRFHWDDVSGDSFHKRLIWRGAFYRVECLQGFCFEGGMFYGTPFHRGGISGDDFCKRDVWRDAVCRVGVLEDAVSKEGCIIGRRFHRVEALGDGFCKGVCLVGC